MPNATINPAAVTLFKGILKTCLFTMAVGKGNGENETEKKPNQITPFM
jgi:hypothetical protein